MNQDIIKFIEEIDSTNCWMFRLLSDYPELPHGVCLIADHQTKGKGQPGNYWEAEKGKNLLFSVLLHPERVSLGQEFRLSQMVALAIQQTLQEYVEECVTIKWPNDIYIGENKICGILIENSVMGSRIANCIAGIGLNINQVEFKSDAPNPISLKQLSGNQHNRKEILLKILERLLRYYDSYPSNDRALHSEYMSVLYRKMGYYAYRIVSTQETIQAIIVGIAPNGILTLKEKKGKEHTFAFKQIQFLHTR